MVKHSGGEVDVSSGTGVSNTDGAMQPIVKLRVSVNRAARDTEGTAEILLRPYEARAIGLDLIGAAHSSVVDAYLRFEAKEHGLDGDSMLLRLRQVTDAALGPG